jgi:hypothetical protein
MAKSESRPKYYTHFTHLPPEQPLSFRLLIFLYPSLVCGELLASLNICMVKNRLATVSLAAM